MAWAAPVRISQCQLGKPPFSSEKRKTAVPMTKTNPSPSPPAAGPAKLVKDSAATEVSRTVLKRVLSGEFPAGARLPSERDLAAQLGVARNAVREGVRPLVLLGILEVQPGSGTFVKGTSSDLLPEVIEWGLLLGRPNFQQVLEAQRLIEMAVAALAAERRSAHDVRSMRTAVSRMGEAKSPDRFDTIDEAFHEQIAEAANNDVLAGILTEHPITSLRLDAPGRIY